VADLLTRTIALNCGIDHAFAVFTDKIDLWWPRGHRKHREGVMRLDAKAGGALIDRALDGSEYVMGEVTAFDPPSRLSLEWFPGSAAAPTWVDIAFAEAGSGTSITVTHRPLLESQSIWPQRVETFTRGWDAVLPALKSYIAEH